mmetsp:Transcript_7884/g.22563  ORF Transcript_7884/g.22563 Transcript_7884/m.22563 type:complete len:282 (+) Transcript_7884:614-1459(+)
MNRVSPRASFSCPPLGLLKELVVPLHPVPRLSLLHHDEARPEGRDGCPPHTELGVSQTCPDASDEHGDVDVKDGGRVLRQLLQYQNRCEPLVLHPLALKPLQGSLDLKLDHVRSHGSARVHQVPQGLRGRGEGDGVGRGLENISKVVRKTRYLCRILSQQRHVDEGVYRPHPPEPLRGLCAIHQVENSCVKVIHETSERSSTQLPRLRSHVVVQSLLGLREQGLFLSLVPVLPVAPRQELRGIIARRLGGGAPQPKRERAPWGPRPPAAQAPEASASPHRI